MIVFKFSKAISAKLILKMATKRVIFPLLLILLIISLDPGISIGIVTAIAAPASIKVDFEGNGGHAGAVLMPNRCAFLVLQVHFILFSVNQYKRSIYKPKLDLLGS